VVVREAAQRLRFAREAFDAARPEQRRVEQLDGDARVVAPVAAMRKPHGAHAAQVRGDGAGR
jgi:hypothetical protein